MMEIYRMAGVEAKNKGDNRPQAAPAAESIQMKNAATLRGAVPQTA